MKYLLIPLVFAAGSALACPGEGKSKDAMAPAAAQQQAAAAKPAATAAVKPVTKVVAKPAAEVRKTASL